jgi:hypothetical protein
MSRESVHQETPVGMEDLRDLPALRLYSESEHADVFDPELPMKWDKGAEGTTYRARPADEIFLPMAGRWRF